MAENVEGLHRYFGGLQILLEGFSRDDHCLKRIIRVGSDDYSFSRESDSVSGAPNSLRESSYLTRGHVLDYKVDVSDIDAEFE